MIMTTFPDSERELTQWKGRSARGDNGGQYTFVLNNTDIHDQALLETFRLPGPNTFSELLIGELAKQSEAKIKEKMDKNAAEVIEGQRLNELCDVFYARVACDNGKFPANPEQGKLRDFLSGSARDLESIKKFYVSVGLISTTAEFTTKYP